MAKSPVMDVLVLSPDSRVWGGITSFINMMVANLKDSNVTLMPTGSLRDAGEGDKRGESLPALALRLFVTPFRVARKVRRGNFSVVHINPSMEEKSLLRDSLILLALHGAGYRQILVYFHGWRVGLEQRIRKNFILRWCLAWLLNGTARIAVLAPEFKEGLEAMGVESRRIVITRTMFDGAALKAAMQDPLPQQQRRNVLFLSRFSRKKGVYELLEAFARIAPEFPDTDLVMAGDGEENAGLLKRAEELGIEERIRFPGYVTGIDKWRLLLGCAVYALPTYFAEGMPVALLEAMAAGKPVLTASTGGVKHIVSDPKSGVVLPEVTVDSVAAGLKKLLGDARYREEAGASNAHYAWKHFEAASVTADIESMYREIAAG